jgi:hypothetical protein
MHPQSDAWDTAESLEYRCCGPHFRKCWRAFMRACAGILVNQLPAEAVTWMAAADAYERGALTPEALTAVRVDALQFHDSQSKTGSPEELSGLRTVMCRLWPEVADDRLFKDRWFEEAVCFLDFCHETGLADDQLLVLLREHFVSVLDDMDSR